MNHEVNDIKPSSLSHIVGQRSVVDQVRVALDACFQDNRRMDHCLLVGPPGLGKSALANIVAQEMATEFHEVLGQSIVTPGSVVFRHGKGNKQRTVPLPLAARKAMQVYLETRPPVAEGNVFIGERGPIGSVRLGESTFRCLPPARKHRLGSILPACGSSAD